MTTTAEAWHEWRGRGLGASDVGAVLGISPFASAFTVYAEKAEGVSVFTENEATDFGKRAEKMLAEWFHDRTGLHVVGEQTWCSHREHAWCRATVDGFVAESEDSALADALGVWEAKTTGASSWAEMPPHIQAQVQWQLFVTGMEHAWVSTLHGFYAWAMRHGLTDSDPTTMMDRPRTHAGLPRPIGDDDLAYAVTVADAQMRAWLACGALAGMRVGEIAGLKRPDVIEGRSRLRILGKGRRERVVPLHPALLEALRAAGLPRTGPVFTRPGGGPWSGAAVSRRMAGFFHDLGIDATAHQLRHWFATQTYAGCGDLLVVQNLLGHSSPTTTAVYTAWSRPAADAAVEALALPR
jgi:integrase/recombinase XerC